jgi:hypothetical protein
MFMRVTSNTPPLFDGSKPNVISLCVARFALAMRLARVFSSSAGVGAGAGAFAAGSSTAVRALRRAAM